MKVKLLFSLLLLGILAAANNATPQSEVLKLDPSMTVRPTNEDGLRFLLPDEEPLRMTGFLWFETDRVYRRLPAKPAVPFPGALENLAWHTAGGQVAFRSDTARITVKVKLRGSGAMYHMPLTGSSGFDLYVGEPGRSRYQRTARFNAGALEYSSELFKSKPGVMREFTINFPLYNGVESVYFGIDEKAGVEAPSPWADPRPVVVYGTSITQGGCASRPGMAYTNILSRKLNRPFINLGFSGNGKGEPEVAAEIAAVTDPAMFILDYEANAGALEKLRQTLPRFIEILREKHPVVPMLVVSRIRRGSEALDVAPTDNRRRGPLVESGAWQKSFIDELRQQGDRNIFFLDGGALLGENDWDECTVDASHPTDLGFHRMAENLLPTVQKILLESKATGQ